MRKGAAGAIQDLARRLIPDATVTVDGDTLVVANKDGGCDRAGVVALRDNFAGADSPVTVLFRTIRCPDGSVELPTSK